MEQSKTQRPSGRVDELLDALPKYIEAQVKKEMLAHLKDYHNMSFGIDDIYGCCDTIRNFEKDLSLYSKSIQQAFDKGLASGIGKTARV